MHLGKTFALTLTIGVASAAEETVLFTAAGANAYQQGVELARAGRLADAEPLLRTAAREISSAYGPTDLRTIRVNGVLGNILAERGTTEGIQMLTRTVSQLEGVAGHDPQELLRLRNNLGAAYAASGRLAEAERMYRAVVEQTSDPATLSNLAAICRKTGRAAEGLALARESVALQTTVASLNVLGAIEYELGRPRNAEEAWRRALAMSDSSGMTATNLAQLYHDEHRFQEALELWDQALRLREQRYGPRHLNTVAVLEASAATLRKLGRKDEARARLERAKMAAADSPGRFRVDMAELSHQR